MAEQPSKASRRCTAISANGRPCRAWAVHGSHPPRCAPHGGGRTPTGAPHGNQNARTHGFYAAADKPDEPDQPCTIDLVIADLLRKHNRLSRYIDSCADNLTPDQILSFHRLHGQNCSRLGRLLVQRRALRDNGTHPLDGAIAQALKELGEDFGVDLSPAATSPDDDRRD
jgi:hypothetical protein